MGRGVGLVVLASLLEAGAAGPAATQEPPAAPPLTFATAVDLILVDAVVTDGQGRLVKGLHADDFVVREDGLAQEVTSFEAVDLAAPAAPSSPAPASTPDREAGRVFVIALDDTGLGLESAIAARGAAKKFLFATARDGDLVNLVVPGNGLNWSARLPEGMAHLLSIVDGVESRRAGSELGGGWEALGAAESLDPLAKENLRTRLDANNQMPRTARFANESDQAYEARNREFQDPLLQSEARRQVEQDRDRRRRLFEGVSAALESVAEVRGRKSVLLFSEGFVREPNDPPFRNLVATLRRYNASIYFVNVLGLRSGAAADSRQAGDRSASSRAANPLDSAGADMVAEETGGFTVRSQGELESGLVRVAEEASRYYLLGYTPSNAKRDGKYRQLEVVLRRPDLRVRARKGYFGPSDKAAAKAPAKGAADPELEGALQSALPANGVPVRLATFAQEPVEKGKVRIRVAAEVGLKTLQTEATADGTRMATLDVALALNHVRPEGRLRTPWREWKVAVPALPEGSDSWAALEGSFDVPAGAAQAQLVVRDRRSRALGSVRYDFDVPEPGSWRVSTPILSDLPGDEKDRSPRLLVDRTFVAGRRLYCYLEVYPGPRKKSAPAPGAALAYTLVDASGKTRIARTPTPLTVGPAGIARRLETIPLSGLDAGSYELRLVVQDAGGRTHELREPLVLRRPDHPDAAMYAELLQAFLAGDVERASAGVMEWRAKDLEKLAESLAPDDRVRRGAALHLHTALAFRLWGHARAPEAEAQIAIARAVLAKDPPPDLQRDWLLELGYFQLAGSSPAKALAYFEDATRRFPDSAEAWLGAGMGHEFTAFPDGFVFAAGTTRDAAGKALRAYREASRLDPGLVEARLRLGRVLGLSGAYDEAEKEFAAVESSGDERLTALARIFGGGLRDARGDLAGAVRQYEAAVAADPESSMAAFALSEALLRSGRHGEASECLAVALRPSVATELSPWFAYHLGRAHRSALFATPPAAPTFTAGSEP